MVKALSLINFRSSHWALLKHGVGNAKIKP